MQRKQKTQRGSPGDEKHSQKHRRPLRAQECVGTVQERGVPKLEAVLRKLDGRSIFVFSLNGQLGRTSRTGQDSRRASGHACGRLSRMD